MTRRSTVRPRARQDIVEHAAYLSEQAGHTTAEHFLQALERTLAALVELPGMGSPRLFQHPKLKGVRVFPVHGFGHHLIFYRLTRTGIAVVRVLHASRDLGGVL